MLAASGGPLDGGASTRTGLPGWRNLGKEVGEDVGGSAATGAVDRQDRVAGKADPWVVLGDARIVPLGDVAQVDVGDYVTRKVQVLCDARNVVDRNHRT